MVIKYVAPSGNNALDGTTFATAYRDVGYGVSQLKSGDKLVVYGTGATRFNYVESLINGFPTAAAWEVATRVEAAPGENVWLTPSAADYVVLFSASSQAYIDFNGINLDGSLANYGGVKIEAWANGNPHHIRFQNATVLGPAQGFGRIIQGIICDSQKAGQIGGNEFRHLSISQAVSDDFTHGIYIKSGGNIVDSCNIHTVTGACIHLYSTYPASGNVISRNRLHDVVPCGAGQRHWGLIVTDNCPNTQVIANVVFRIPYEGASSVGILVSTNAHGCAVVNNTASACPAVGMQMDPTVNGGMAYNNLSYGNGINFARTGLNPQASHNQDSNPGFIDPSQNDFRILTSSPAAKAGVVVPGLTLDALGALFGNPPSVGAYEAVGSPSGGGGGGGEPQPVAAIQFTQVPPFGSFDDLRGTVSNVDPSLYQVAVYIQVGTFGWWTKPYLAQPTTGIAADGSWTCDITTGGVDEQATGIVAFVVPKAYSPPLVSGLSTLPPELASNAIAQASVTRTP